METATKNTVNAFQGLASKTTQFFSGMTGPQIAVFSIIALLAVGLLVTTGVLAGKCTAQRCGGDKQEGIL